MLDSMSDILYTCIPWNNNVPYKNAQKRIANLVMLSLYYFNPHTSNAIIITISANIMFHLPSSIYIV